MQKKTVYFCILYYYIFTVNNLKVSAQTCNNEWANPPKISIQQLNNKYYAIRENEKNDQNTLILANVIFRHGDRAADGDDMYPNDPHMNFTYYPVGHGQLTNLGKEQEYNIGLTLRNRYNEFLGNIYITEVQDARSTNLNRTKASLELALAGLWPPVKEQIWHPSFLWQPIPYNYWEKDKDELMGDPNVACPNFRKIYEKNLANSENENENEKLKEFYNYINYHTGLNASVPQDIYNLFFTLKAEEAWGLTLPDWTKCVWPEKILDVAVKQFEMFTQTPELRQLSCGMLLNKIVKDSMDVINNKLEPKGRKIFLYSGHERNVAFALISLGLFHPHMPPYSSFVIIELHNIDNVYGVKVYYQDYSENNPRLLTIPGCKSFCPFDEFYKLIENNLPKGSCRETQ